MTKKWTPAALLREYQQEVAAFVREMEPEYKAHVAECKEHDEDPVTREEWKALCKSEYPSYPEWLKLNHDKGNFKD